MASDVVVVLFSTATSQLLYFRSNNCNMVCHGNSLAAEKITLTWTVRTQACIGRKTEQRSRRMQHVTFLSRARPTDCLELIAGFAAEDRDTQQLPAGHPAAGRQLAPSVAKLTKTRATAAARA